MSDSERSTRYANMGCGSTWHEEWENYDLVPSDPSVRRMDIVKQWSLSTKAYDAIYSSHVLEHLKRHQVRRFLINCYNSLRPGGTLRIVVPDLEGICREYLRQLDAVRGGDAAAVRRHQWVTLELLDQMVRTSSGGAMGRLWASGPLPEEDFIVERVGREAGAWIEQLQAQGKVGADVVPYEQVYADLPDPADAKVQRFRERGEIHQWMYDECSLTALLESIGFEVVQRHSGTSSSIPDFERYGLDADRNGDLMKPDSLFVEGRRPLA